MNRGLEQWNLTELRRQLERGEVSAMEALRACLAKIRLKMTS